MAVNVAISGFGRIGRLVLRAHMKLKATLKTQMFQSMPQVLR